MKYFLGLLLCVSLGAQIPNTTPDGFRVAKPGYVFSFPRDHGNHPEFKTEWWYITGHFQDDTSKHRYGYQLTFFRQASPKGLWRGSRTWSSDQIYMAHAALTNEQGKTFTFDERLNRGGLLARSSEKDLNVVNESWSMKRQPNGTIDIKFNVKSSMLSLALVPETSLVTFGTNGVSRKGEDPTAASYYLTYPRLSTTGTLATPQGKYRVSGLSWMDHEISSNQLSPNQTGWDWAGIHLNDKTSLMFYRLRLASGKQDPYSSITEINAKGSITRSTNDFVINVLSTWTSPISKTTYPAEITITAWGRTYRLKPILENQELVVKSMSGLGYWEGACKVFLDNQEVGSAYLELTGYQ